MKYPSDLHDKEWDLISSNFTPKSKRGRPRKHSQKDIFNAILYILKGGSTWRMMPNDLPPWQTVYDHFSRWSKNGVWELVLTQLNTLARNNAERNDPPSYGIIDAQSVKTQYACEERGIDGGKKVKGHKRHITVDTLGNLLHIHVHAANISDTKAACEVFVRTSEKYPSINAYSGDAGYRGTAVNFVKEQLNMTLHISTKIKDGWAVLPKKLFG